MKDHTNTDKLFNHASKLHGTPPSETPTTIQFIVYTLITIGSNITTKDKTLSDTLYFISFSSGVLTGIKKEIDNSK